jgi:hypothetical protein
MSFRKYDSTVHKNVLKFGIATKILGESLLYRISKKYVKRLQDIHVRIHLYPCANYALGSGGIYRGLIEVLFRNLAEVIAENHENLFLG